MRWMDQIESPHWEEYLRDAFGYAVLALEHDPARPLASFAHEIRGWLAESGVAGVRHHLSAKMRAEDLEDGEVQRCMEELVEQHRAALLRLMEKGEIPRASLTYFAPPGPTEDDFNEVMGRLVQSERPFEEWMYSQGRTESDVAKIFASIDESLNKLGIKPPPFPSRKKG